MRPCHGIEQSSPTIETIRLVGTAAKFTLGKNERKTELDESMTGLESVRQTTLASLMRRANNP